MPHAGPEVEAIEQIRVATSGFAPAFMCWQPGPFFVSVPSRTAITGGSIASKRPARRRSPTGIFASQTILAAMSPMDGFYAPPEGRPTVRTSAGIRLQGPDSRSGKTLASSLGQPAPPSAALTQRSRWQRGTLLAPRINAASSDRRPYGTSENAVPQGSQAWIGGASRSPCLRATCVNSPKLRLRPGSPALPARRRSRRSFLTPLLEPEDLYDQLFEPNDLTLARHRPSLAKSQRACTGKAWPGENVDEPSSPAFTTGPATATFFSKLSVMFRSSLDTSIKPILCPRKSGPTHWVLNPVSTCWTP